MCGTKTTVVLTVLLLVVLAVVIVVALLLGLAIAVYGFISDPFSIPFQDYEQLPKDVQLSYENESESMKRVQYFGLGIFFTALCSLVFLSLTKKASLPVSNYQRCNS